MGHKIKTDYDLVNGTIEVLVPNLGKKKTN